MFDGALGVLGGIEVIKVLTEKGYRNNHPLEVISFINEEGTAYSPIGGTFGSRAMMGLIDINGYLKESIKKINLSEKDLKLAYRDPNTIKNYLELHIEQGKKGINPKQKKLAEIMRKLKPYSQSWFNQWPIPELVPFYKMNSQI